ncbi:MAG: hypothetical protein RIB45_16320 [Marivibrio sp.]|uniref:hypothetical protein n=1 Tax=Marivibrio sp. TaxID=2039719 RepID=UPI0032EC96AC
MSRAQSTLGRCADGMEAVTRALDETDLALKSAARRMDGAAALVARVERDGPVAALPEVIEQLRADLIDRSNSRFADQYAETLDRALDVQARIGRR